VILLIDEPLLACGLPIIFDFSDGSNRYALRLFELFGSDQGDSLGVRYAFVFITLL
jgi:hypothetical protein